MYSVHLICVHSEITSGEIFATLNLKEQINLFLYQKQIISREILRSIIDDEVDSSLLGNDAILISK